MKSPFSEHWPIMLQNEAESLLLSFFLLVILLVLIALWQKKRQKKSESSHEEKDFLADCKEIGLSKNEIEEIRTMAKLINRKSAEVLEVFYFFELGVDARLDEKNSPSEETVTTIEALRRKAGYDKVPMGQPLLSSRNLTPNQPVSLLFSSGNTENRTLCRIHSVSERALTIKSTDTSFPPVLEDDTVQILVQQPGDGEYTFALTIKRVSSESELVFDHSLQFQRKQARAYIRVETDAVAKFRFTQANKAPDRLQGGSRFEGILRDLSGGGTLLESSEKFDAGDRLIISFIFQGESFYGIKAQVLRARERVTKQEKRFLHQIQFTDIDNAVREKLIKLIFARHREEVQWQRTLSLTSPRRV